jgi:hypothetical protein
MIRHLHPTDSPALLHFKQASGADEVFTLAQAVKSGKRPFPLVKYTSAALSPRAWQTCWVKTRRARVLAVMRAGPRSGPHAWEVTNLFVARKSIEAAADVLEQIAFPAGIAGARRVFIRLRGDSAVFEQARRAGYQHVYSETAYSAPSANDIVARIGSQDEALELRPLSEADRHARYRLYCASMPIDARSKAGQTIEEWADADEKPARKVREWGLEGQRDGSLEAHVRTADVAGGRFFAVTCSRDARCSYERLIAAGVGEAGEKAAYTIAPSYNPGLAAALEEVGFEPVNTFDVMVKMLAVQVERPVAAMVAAGS